MKFIIFLLLLIGAWYLYTNQDKFDFMPQKQQTITETKKEKTIFKVNDVRKKQYEETQEVLGY